MTISRLSSNSLTPTKTIPWGNFSNTPTGTYADSDGDWKYVRFTANGTLTITDSGYFDVLVLGGGAGGTAGTQNGFGGRSVRGLWLIPSGSYAVTVGAGGSSGLGGSGKSSSIGSLIVSGETGANATMLTTTEFTSSITGTPVAYATPAVDSNPQTANLGRGGSENSNRPGGSGVVIVRVRTN